MLRIRIVRLRGNLCIKILNKLPLPLAKYHIIYTNYIIWGANIYMLIFYILVIKNRFQFREEFTVKTSKRKRKWYTDVFQNTNCRTHWGAIAVGGWVCLTNQSNQVINLSTNYTRWFVHLTALSLSFNNWGKETITIGHSIRQPSS